MPTHVLRVLSKMNWSWNKALPTDNSNSVAACLPTTFKFQLTTATTDEGNVRGNVASAMSKWHVNAVRFGWLPFHTA